MRKILNIGLLAILGVMTALAPSCTKDLKNDINDIKNKIETLATTASLDSKIKAVETQLTTLGTNIEKEIKASKDKITAIEGQIPTLATKADLAALTARVVALETWKTTVITELSDIKADLVKVREEYKAGDDAIIAELVIIENKLAGDIARIDGQIEGLLGSVSSMTADILANADEIAKNAAAIAANAENAAKDIAANNALILKNHAEYLAKITEVESRVGALEAKNLLIDEAIEANKAAIAANSGDIAANLTAANEEYAKIRVEIASTEEKLQALIDSGLEGELTEVIERLNEIDTAIEGINEDIVAINTEITAIQNRLDVIEGRIQAINFISDYADGKATLYSIVDGADLLARTEMTMRFRVYPANQAANLVASYTANKGNFTLNFNEVKTRAALPSLDILSITATEDDLKKGDIIVVAKTTGFVFTPKTTYSLSLDVVSGIDNTSSNVFAINATDINKADIVLTDNNTEMGGAVINTFDIDYNDVAKTFSVTNDTQLGNFASGVLVDFITACDFKKEGITTKVVKVVTYDKETATETTTPIAAVADITTAQTAATAAGLTLDVAAQTVKVKAVDIKKIGSYVTLTVESSYLGVLISTSTVKVIITPKSLTYTYETPVVLMWDPSFTNKDTKFELANVATLTGLTVQALVTELANGFVMEKNGDGTLPAPNPASLSLTNPETDKTFFTISALKETGRWINQAYTDITLTKTLADGRVLTLIIKKITLATPTVTLSKAEGFWIENGTKLQVTGQYSPVNSVTTFKMNGDLRNGFGATVLDAETGLPVALPAGVGVEFKILTANTNTSKWELADGYDFNFITYDPTADVVKVSTHIVYTTDGSVRTEIPVAEYKDVIVVPRNPISDISVKQSGGVNEVVKYTENNADMKFDLNNYIRFTEKFNGVQLRQDAPSVTDQKDYYVSELGGKFAASFKSYDQFGLSLSPYTAGAVFTMGDIRYSDGTAVDASTKGNLISNANLNSDGSIQFNYVGISLNKNVEMTINVKINNFWGVSTGAVLVTIQKSNI